MTECVVEITIHWRPPDMVIWLVQSDDDLRSTGADREQATVFANPDAAIAAAETFLVEEAAEWERDDRACPNITYQIVRW
jgi:hypothetical protein